MLPPVGLIPSGSKDPFALRRAAQGVVKILVEGGLALPVDKLLGGDAQLSEFFLDRVRYYFREIRGYKYDEVNAVLAAGCGDLTDVDSRLAAIAQVRTTADFEPLAASFKRIKNILRQAEFEGGGEVDAALLEAGAIRFKPIVLTAAAAMIGASVILTDPIFQGLAISLLFGLASSTLLTVLVIPAIYVVLRDDGKPAPDQ